MIREPYVKRSWKEKMEILKKELERFPEILEEQWRRQREEKEFAERVCGPAVEEYIRMREKFKRNRPDDNS